MFNPKCFAASKVSTKSDGLSVTIFFLRLSPPWFLPSNSPCHHRTTPSSFHHWPPAAELSSSTGTVPEFKPVSAGEKNSVVSVFIGNLPPKASNRWIFNFFKAFGTVADYYIPGGVSKYNRKPYGFVRFFSLDVANRAVAHSNGTWIEGYRLEVALARFPQKTAMASNFGRGMTDSKLGDGEFRPVNHSLGSWAHPGKSFAQVLCGDAGIPTREVRSDSSIFTVDSKVCDYSWVNLSAIANISWGVNFEDVLNGLLLNVNGLCLIKRLGIRKFLLVFDSLECREAALAEGAWLGLVEDVAEWRGEMVCGKKLWRLSCSGILISAWCHDTFKSIASVWGSLVALEKATSNASDLTAAVLIIESKSDFISGSINLAVDGRFFPVRVSGVVVEKALGKSLVVLRQPLTGESVADSEEGRTVDVLENGFPLHESGMVCAAPSSNKGSC